MTKVAGFQKCGLHCKCGEPAKWVYSEIGMSIAYCDEHAGQDALFGRTDPDEEFTWKRIPEEEQETTRAIRIPGITKNTEELAQSIHRLRYDVIAQFYGDTATELRSQSEQALSKGEISQSRLLDSAASTAQMQQVQFARLWTLYKPQDK